MFGGANGRRKMGIGHRCTGTDWTTVRRMRQSKRESETMMSLYCLETSVKTFFTTISFPSFYTDTHTHTVICKRSRKVFGFGFALADSNRYDVRLI